MSTLAIKLLANTKSRTETGLERIMSDVQTYTSYGAKLKKEFKPFLPGDEDKLNACFDDMDVLKDFASAQSDRVTDVITCLYAIKEMGLTLDRCQDQILTVVELFEIKAFLLKTRRISEIFDSSLSKVPEAYRLVDTTKLLDIMDPSGQRMDTFYIYDAFSPALAELRKEKRQLELELRRAQKAVRAKLEQDYGFRMTPKCELLVPKSDKPAMELAMSLSELQKSEEDYMSVVFTIAPNEEIYAIEGRREQLDACIEDEELNVCQSLTKAIARDREKLLHNCNVAGRIDLDLAKVLYALEHSCTRPEIANEHVIFIQDGRNLLVEDVLKEKGKEYCPVSVELSDGVTAITGANMGGKTISLKMMGQVALLTQYAMYVPCKAARIGLSNFIQMLIGDSQNVQRGLSSFGSEMEELREILDNAKDRSLIMIDEIASGTNPTEGLALTKSFIKYFSRRPYITVITTHFDHAAVGCNTKNLQVLGLSGADFGKLSREIAHAGRKERIEIIGKAMDYRLAVIEDETKAPRDALNIAKMLGVYDEIIDEARGYLI